MCAFQHSPSQRNASKTDDILSHNAHSHPALKQIHDQSFGFDRSEASRSRSRSPLNGASSILTSRTGPSQHKEPPGSDGAGPSGGPTASASAAASPLNGSLAGKKRGKRTQKSGTASSSPDHHDDDEHASSPHYLSERLNRIQGHSQNRPGRHPHHHHHHHMHRRYPYNYGSQSDFFDFDYIPGSPSTGMGGGIARHHVLSRDNKSVQNIADLGRLVDNHTGYHEDKRASDEFLAEIGKRKNGSALKSYYERLNATLDGWREVDEILDSHFPQEVMLRFGTVEEVERFRRPPGMAHRAISGADDDNENDSGYQEESESDHDVSANRSRRRQSGIARAASALSGLWFGTPTRSRERSARQLDEESALLSSSIQPDSPSIADASADSYGATAKAVPGKVPGTGLTPIKNEDANAIATVKRAALKTAAESMPTVAELPSKDEEVSVTVTDMDEPAKDSRHSRTPPKAKPGLAEPSSTDSDDEMEEEGEDEDEPGGVSTDKLHRRLGEERKGRERTREGAAVHTGTDDRSKGSVERSTSAGKQISRQEPGGLSERDRMRLLQHVPGREEREGERERGTQFAININLAINVLLLAGKVVAVFSSNSVSLIASLVDSALDLLSTIIIFGTSKAISYRSFHTYFKYPVGKKRFEPLGVVIFAVLMIASFVQVLVESVERLYAVIRTGSEKPGGEADLPLVGVAFMVLTIVIKLFMWLIYRESPSSGVRAVAQDAENDVVFNIASLIFPVIGSKLGWPALDPVGGVCLSIYIIHEWLETLTETVSKLTGAVGSSQDISRALYLILRFRSVNSVSAFELYHAGDDMIVEADVVLPHSLALKEAHDLGEIITYCTEGIALIERAYIHLDYNPVGQAGHITGRG